MFGALVWRRRRCRPRTPPKSVADAVAALRARRRFAVPYALIGPVDEVIEDSTGIETGVHHLLRISADAIDIVAPLLDWLRLKLTRWAHVRDPALDRLHRRRATARSWRAVWTWRLEASTGPV
jgi:hypothetical protein